MEVRGDEIGSRARLFSRDPRKFGPLIALVYTVIAGLSVAIEDPRDAELLRWIENQISDLPVELIGDVETASVAVTIEPIVEGFVVSVADQRTGRTVVRELRSDKKDRRSRLSALREAVALSIRGTLQALAFKEPPRDEGRSGAGGRRGGRGARSDPAVAGDRSDRAASGARSDRAASGDRGDPADRRDLGDRGDPADRGDLGDRTDRAERAERREPEERSDLGERDELPFYASIGWRAGAAGSGIDIDQGLTARGGLSLGRIELGAELSIGLPLALTDDLTHIELTRHRALLNFGLALAELGRHFHLIASLAAGASIAHRSAVPRTEGVTVREASTRAGLLASVETRLRFGRPLALELSLGADFIPGAPIFEYARSGAQMERARLWIVQPKIGAAIFFSSP